MDNELFLKRLSELAEVTQIKPPRSASVRETNEPSTIWRSGREMEIDRKDNPTLNIASKRLKVEAKPCEDCGKMVKDRCVNRSLYTFPKRHWRKSCTGCDCVWNPETGAFDLDLKSAQAYFVRLYKNCDK